MTPKWDTTLGAKMHQDGCSDKEIAEHFGIAVSTVSYQRRNRWEKVLENSTPEDDFIHMCAVEEPAKESTEVVINTSTHTSGKQPLDVYELLEEATTNMHGIKAICTADAILQLWKWDRKENLLKARAAIDYLLKKMEDVQ